jgi:hypothetical protein
MKLSQAAQVGYNALKVVKSNTIQFFWNSGSAVANILLCYFAS